MVPDIHAPVSVIEGNIQGQKKDKEQSVKEVDRTLISRKKEIKKQDKAKVHN